MKPKKAEKAKKAAKTRSNHSCSEEGSGEWRRILSWWLVWGTPALRPEKKYHGLYARIQWQGLDLHLLNPTTFMNRSGLAIKALADFFKIQPQQILIAHDELDLPPGTAKLKKGGGHGGHNGLRDTIAHLGTNDFQRLRIGIGHPGDSRRVTGYVLGRLGKQETEELNAVIDEIMRVLPDAASGKLPAAMNRLHSFKPV